MSSAVSTLLQPVGSTKERTSSSASDSTAVFAQVEPMSMPM